MNRTTDQLPLYMIQSTLEKIIANTKIEGSNTKAANRQLATQALAKLKPSQIQQLPDADKAYEQLRAAGVKRSMAVVAKDWSEQDRHKLICEARKYQVEKERIEAHYYATFKQLHNKIKNNF